MERIGIEDKRYQLADLVKRVEAGETIVLTRCGRDVACITAPETQDTDKVKQFFNLLKKVKTHSSIQATPEEIRIWVQEGRM